MNLIPLAVFALVFAISSPSMSSPIELESSESLYLGEKKQISLELINQEDSSDLEWAVDKSDLVNLDGGELISIEPKVLGTTLNIDLTAPYIAPSFANKEVLLVGRDPITRMSLVTVRIDLSVRAELVIRFRERDEASFASIIPSPQADSDYEWDIPMDPTTGDYLPITVNNHKKGLWVRFRYEGKNPNNLLRSDGYVIHIYRGEGEYIVHQPFDKDTYLKQSNCPLEPISEDEWENPRLGLTAKGQDWANCEFRGFVPEGMAYGFGYREHYLESEEHEKRVEIKNVGELNTALIEYYQFLEESRMGDPLSAMCSSW